MKGSHQTITIDHLEMNGVMEELAKPAQMKVKYHLDYFELPVLVNPFVDPETDPTVYGLMYTVNVGMAISPGLYKIAGISLDGLTRIGDIEYSEQDGWLLLSCALDDLLADADVAEWLDSDYPMFATVSTTSQITLTTGIQEADYTTGGAILLKAHEVRGINQFSPVLQDLSYDISLDGTHLNNLSITYLDQDDNAPPGRLSGSRW